MKSFSAHIRDSKLFSTSGCTWPFDIFRAMKPAYFVIFCAASFFILLSFHSWSQPRITMYTQGTRTSFLNLSIDNKRVIIANFAFLNSSDQLEPEDQNRIDDYEELSCKFARLDPFEPSIEKYMRHPRTIDCKKVQDYDMTYIDDDGFVRINSSEWERATIKFNGSSISCTCRTFDRPLAYTDNDNSIVYGPSERLDPDYPLRMPGDFVEVACKNDTDGNDFYLNIHAHPTTCGKRTFKDSHEAPEDQLSVLMMVIDSVSLSALKRNLPSTYKYLTEKMGFYTFNGYNKVGDNSRPNMFPVLTGKRIQYEQPDMPSEVDDPNRFLDNDPELIWKRFASQNYSVVMNEDFPTYGLFHFGSKGYHRKPADFYYHALWLGVGHMVQKTGSSRFCYGNVPELQLQIDLTRKHLELFSHKLQFVYSFFAYLSHDYDAAIEGGDDKFASFFRRIHEEKPEVINRTVIIFMADHGHRFSKIRETLIGLIEERQPMFLIRFPQWFYKKYPEIQQNLQINTMRLSSPFDVYETLKDILERNYRGAQRARDARGLSMLYPIPKNRTCALAGIPEHYCTCVDNQIFNTTNELSVSAADFLTSHLNDIVKNSSSWSKNGTSCQKWEWKNISRAERLGVSAKVKAGIKDINTWNKYIEQNEVQQIYDQLSAGEKLRIAARMDPRDAFFEAELLYNGKNGNWTVLGEVSRLDAYGNQSWCVEHEIYRKYCFCK